MDAEPGPELVVRPVEGHERQVVVRHPEPRADPSLRVLDLDLPGPDDAFPHVATSLPGRRLDALSLGRASRPMRGTTTRRPRGGAGVVDAGARAVMSRAGRGASGAGTDPGCEKPPRPEGRSGLSSRTVWAPVQAVKPRRTVLSLFLQPLGPDRHRLEDRRVGIDADAGAGGDRHRPVGSE